MRSVCGTHQSGGDAREPAGEMGLEVKTKAGLEMGERSCYAWPAFSEWTVWTEFCGGQHGEVEAGRWRAQEKPAEETGP